MLLRAVLSLKWQNLSSGGTNWPLKSCLLFYVLFMAALKFHWPAPDTICEKTFISKCPPPERNVSNHAKADGMVSAERNSIQHCTSTCLGFFFPIVSRISTPLSDQLQGALFYKWTWTLIVLWRLGNLIKMHSNVFESLVECRNLCFRIKHTVIFLSNSQCFPIDWFM